MSLSGPLPLHSFEGNLGTIPTNLEFTFDTVGLKMYDTDAVADSAYTLPVTYDTQ